MRPSIRKFIETCSEVLPIQNPVYEFGSMWVPEQEKLADLRPIFKGYDYVGADMQSGPGVDRVLDLHAIDLPDESVGMAISCDTLEHVEYPRKAITELYRILKPGGVLIITSVMLYPIHAAPNDYWRFTPEGFRSLLSVFPSVYVDWNGREDNPHTVIGIGVKGQWAFTPDTSWKNVRDIPVYLPFLAFLVKIKKQFYWLLKQVNLF